MNAPQTFEGLQVWDLAERMNGQLRAIQGAVLGFDLGAGLALARALCVDPLAAAEMLPEVEAAMVRKLNEQIKAAGDG